VLKLVRRPESDFLIEKHRRGRKAREDSAWALAANAALTAAEKSKRIGARWDAFRAGRTSRGTFDALWVELQGMSFNRCALCETPAPDTVEHLEEKAQAPEKAFTWSNLLPACSTCNRHRENSGVVGSPLDPSDGEPLDYFGWDEHGSFMHRDPVHGAAVDRHVEMYNLRRFAQEREIRVRAVRGHLSAAVLEEQVHPDTRAALEVLLHAGAGWLGPVREYLLRPPSPDDALLIEDALRKLPEIRQWVAPWLRPPLWAAAIWR
jgi:HNH endonuclease